MTDITPARAIIPVEQLDKSILLQALPNSHMEYGILKDGVWCGDGGFLPDLV